MNIIINSYYLDIINGIYNHVLVSRGGKRYWDNNGNWWKDETTYPMYVRFFFEKKKGKSYKDGYFNGNRRELLSILNRLKKGVLPRSERLRIAFDYIIQGYIEDQELLLEEERQYYGITSTSNQSF